MFNQYQHEHLVEQNAEMRDCWLSDIKPTLYEAPRIRLVSALLKLTDVDSNELADMDNREIADMLCVEGTDAEIHSFYESLLD